MWNEHWPWVELVWKRRTSFGSDCSHKHLSKLFRRQNLLESCRLLPWYKANYDLLRLTGGEMSVIDNRTPFCRSQRSQKMRAVRWVSSITELTSVAVRGLKRCGIQLLLAGMLQICLCLSIITRHLKMPNMKNSIILYPWLIYVNCMLEFNLIYNIDFIINI